MVTPGLRDGMIWGFWIVAAGMLVAAILSGCYRGNLVSTASQYQCEEVLRWAIRDGKVESYWIADCPALKKICHPNPKDYGMLDCWVD